MLAIILIGAVYAMVAYMLRGMFGEAGTLWPWFFFVMFICEFTQEQIRKKPRGQKKLDDFYGKIVLYL